MSITLKSEADVRSVGVPRRRRRRHDLAALLYVAPAIMFVLVFFLLPLGMTVWMSLHNWPLIGRPRWIGFANYNALWRDHGFWNALAFTGRYTVAATIGLLAVGLALALFVEKPRPLVGLYRTVFFLPVVIGFASASLLWAWLSSVDAGLFSPLAEQLGLTNGRINLLATFDPAFWSVTVMVIWKMAGFYMIILMSGLQAIPADYHEAARIDGANFWQRFRFITLPLIRRPLALASILCVSGSMLAFDQFYIILAGGPQNQTITAVYWIFNQSFVSFRLGYGSALSVVLLGILMVLSALQLRLFGDREPPR
ncbi:carbohydrate ABC transporter permease [Lichenifustis flavocetrariae]|uniref:Sugar ABC transporter permease n=1 Tax=Lichenifustis flavocetrariae TaxID=2949735 RepID=A0AA42CQM0_9HYPH|nr:sugar ABC transporter permease [Lichenifustis flavocetrariae]MCW6511570.1 sugar ABC transporter permease [Lichenifustis flavocetrariae]